MVQVSGNRVEGLASLNPFLGTIRQYTEAPLLSPAYWTMHTVVVHVYREAVELHPCVWNDVWLDDSCVQWSACFASPEEWTTQGVVTLRMIQGQRGTLVLLHALMGA